MELHALDRQCFMPYTLASAVVYVYKRFLNIVGIVGNYIVVVLARYKHIACGEVLNGVVAAVVSELQLLCLTAERKTDNLMPHADAANRILAD